MLACGNATRCVLAASIVGAALGAGAGCPTHQKCCEAATLTASSQMAVQGPRRPQGQTAWQHPVPCSGSHLGSLKSGIWTDTHPCSLQALAQDARDLPAPRTSVAPQNFEALLLRILGGTEFTKGLRPSGARGVDW